MTELRPEDFGETPSVEVRAYRHGKLIGSRLCVGIDEAAALVAAWEETAGVECEVDDLSKPASDHTSSEVSSTDLDGYPHTTDATDTDALR